MGCLLPGLNFPNTEMQHWPDLLSHWLAIINDIFRHILFPGLQLMSSYNCILSRHIALVPDYILIRPAAPVSRSA